MQKKCSGMGVDLGVICPYGLLELADDNIFILIDSK